MRIPLLDLNRQYQVIGPELSKAIQSVLSSHQYILGPQVRELESEIADYCHTAYAVGCASGSDALLLAFMALDIGAGDEVITTPFSFFATAGSIARLGAKPIFVDIDPITYNINPALIEEAITKSTKAILPVHLFGQCAEMDPIKAIGESHGIPVIEDAAQAIGSQYHGELAGSMGIMGCFSFYPTKNLGAAGDAGMVTTSDETLHKKLRALRSHGGATKYFHETVGVNSRLDTLQAAILLVKLRYLDRWSEGRRHNAEAYRAMFARSGLLERGLVQLPPEPVNMLHIYNQFVIRADRRDDLREFLKQQGIGTEIYYPLSLHLQPCFSSLGYKEGQFPVSEAATKETLALPIYPELTLDEMHFVVGAIRSFYLD